ncbi:iron(III) transport system substrate-binding protein [Arthrobacter ginsengisoli]|uniref:Iron(III) transport system substrate-binding protein n=1 Tax=Arthrobacter ginsengisoli TaxID=1356565 RepID=A0ABU1UDI1_9MICC|nr:extracellular solute-binding protein [Arthrobacter ginsengisoli]MDR7083257.1 iron(III) transport system substrate-binding protein [Arthrobacter ginsengisoli]
MKKKILPIIGAGLIGMLALTACGGPSGAAPNASSAVEATDLDSLIAAAQAEGSLRVYGQIPEDSMTAFAEAFQKKYGIKVNALRLGGNTLASRFDAETQARTATGEVLTATDLEFIKKATDRGDLVSFTDSGVAKLLDGFPTKAMLEDYKSPVLNIVDTGFIYNTKMVEAKELPKSWSELSGSRWARKYCAADPGASASVASFMWTLREKEGDQALSDFGANIGRWYPNVIALTEAVASGECQLGVNSAELFVRTGQKNGAPVEFASQPSALFPVVSAAVAANAEHPNAARLFLHFILSPEGSRLMNDPANGSYGPWDSAEYPADFWVPAPSDLEKVRADTPELLKLLGR